MALLIILLILAVLTGVTCGVLEWFSEKKNPPMKEDSYSFYNDESDEKLHSHHFTSTPKNIRHTGKCDGNCANCPPHYGYRHGRWYYGHNHIEGCVFGGNKGSGGRD